MGTKQSLVQIERLLILAAGEGEVGEQPVDRVAPRSGSDRHAKHVLGLVEAAGRDGAPGFTQARLRGPARRPWAAATARPVPDPPAPNASASQWIMRSA